MAERENVTISFVDDNIYSDRQYDMTLPEAIEWLNRFLAQVPDEFRDNSYFEVSFERGYYDSPSEASFRIGYHRPITNEEIAERAAKVQRVRAEQAAQEQARERQIYEALKAKYG